MILNLLVEIIVSTQTKLRSQSILRSVAAEPEKAADGWYLVTFPVKYAGKRGEIHIEAGQKYRQ